METEVITAEHKEALLKEAEYHQNAMQSRRAIQLKIFTGTIILFLLAANGIDEFAPGTCSEFKQFIVDVHIGAYSSFVLFLFYFIQIERVSTKDRIKYNAIDGILWEDTKRFLKKEDPLRAKKQDKPPEKDREDNLLGKCFRQIWRFINWLWISWAMLIPVIVVLGLAYALSTMVLPSLQSPCS